MRTPILVCLVAFTACTASAQSKQEPEAAKIQHAPVQIQTQSSVKAVAAQKTDKQAKKIVPLKRTLSPVKLQVSPASIQANKAAFRQLRLKQAKDADSAVAAMPRLSVKSTSAVRNLRSAGPAYRTLRIDPNALSYHARMGYTEIRSSGDDCDDSRRDVNPNTSEICNHRDDNCDGVVDENATFRFYLDADGDGQGDASQPLDICPDDQRRAADSGNWLSANGRDCDDSDPDRWRDCAP